MSPGESAEQEPTRPARLAAIDWMRGFVMLLMAFDHASLFYNEGRVALDSAADYGPGQALPTLQFFARWVTHLCAPTFLFLSGTSLALSIARRQNAGQTAWQIDRDLLIRGLLLIGLELLFLSRLAPVFLVSVLTAIGVSMICMIPLRRLSDSALLGGSLVWLLIAEAATSLVWQGQGDASILAALTLARHYTDVAHIIYPVAHWLPMMCLGWVFGQLLHRQPARGVPTLVMWGVGSLLVFAVVRGWGGYGNMFLPAYDNSLVQWLHVSKYPPSLSFVALELGLMALLLAAFLVLENRVAARRNGLVFVLGQTALLFYLLHFVSLGLSRFVLGFSSGGIERALAAALIVVLGLYPLCRAFRGYKQAHPTSPVRFL